MRAIPPCVACAMLLLGLTATGSLADPSIVADLDSNATNGPDTLQAEVGDTILVRVWITDSADSLLGFGITLGDTSGTLAWAEGDTDAVYTTPNGWATVPVQVDENGRLLLQGQDFSFSQPLHMPRQVAQLKFVAVSPESCVVFSWDTAISGWQNWGMDIGGFASFEGAVVCVAGQEEGGDDEGGGDEGGDEGNTPGGGPPDESDGGDDFGWLDSWVNICDSCVYVAEKPETGPIWWIVDTTGTVGVNCDCSNIQACIDIADSGDVVCVKPGSYSVLTTLEYGPPDIPGDSVRASCPATFRLHRDGVRIVGCAGPDSTFVGSEDAADHVCVLVCDPYDSQDNFTLHHCTVAGFTFHDAVTKTISSGTALGTGAMYCSASVESTVVIRGNVFENNRGRHGGAMRINGRPTVLNNIFRYNRCAYWPQGGAGTMPLAGGIMVSGGPGKKPKIMQNVFFENACLHGDTLRPGGALVFEGTGGLVDGNLFYGNWATKGGAIYLTNDSANPKIEANVFDHCSTTVQGGVIALADTGKIRPIIHRNTFIRNSAPNSMGGVIYSNNDEFILNFHRNIVTCSKGGGVVCGSLDPSHVKLTCSDFWMNEWPDIWGVPEDSVDHLLIRDPLLCTSTTCSPYSLSPFSPCRPESTGECLLIGAVGICEECEETFSCQIPTYLNEWREDPLSQPVCRPTFDATPSPFNSTVTLRWRTSVDLGEARITVFDVSGRLVWESPATACPAPGGSVVWRGETANGEQAASGIYWARLRTEKGPDVVRKTLLVR